ncbi:MAG: hypothetical protein V2I24_00685 [Halieaceae bacterium]|jgi:hypothetical protein|nr:hypothetical protein [Halieaceae bacterium]
MTEGSGGKTIPDVAAGEGADVAAASAKGRRALPSAPHRLLLGGLALLPWLGVLLLLYFLESRAVWQAEQPLRAPASVLLLAGGMALSFILHSRLRRR